jgi:hypothetical protein
MRALFSTSAEGTCGHVFRDPRMTAIHPGVRALAVGLSAASAAMVFASPGRAEDAPSLPPSSVPIPAAGMSALIVPDQPDDAATAPMPPPAAEPPPEPSATAEAVVAQVTQEAQEVAANAGNRTLVRDTRPRFVAHPVAVHVRVVSPRARIEPARATRRAARPVHRSIRESHAAWYRVRGAQYQGHVAPTGDAARGRRAPPPNSTASTGPRSSLDRLASAVEPPRNGRSICLPDGSICVESCPPNQLDNLLQNGDWIASCILLPSPSDNGDVGQVTTPGSEPIPPATQSPATPEPQYQCVAPQYHDVCCALATAMELPPPADCGEVFSPPVSETVDTTSAAAPVTSAPSSQAPTGSPGPPGAGTTDVARPPTLSETAPLTENLWDRLTAPPPRSSAALGAGVPRKPVRELAEARPLAAPKATSHRARVQVSPPRPTARREHRSAAPAPRAPTAAAPKGGSLLGWFLVVAGLVMLAALASAAGLDGAAAAGSAVRSRLGSRGLSGRRSRRSRRGGIRYRD